MAFLGLFHEPKLIDEGFAGTEDFCRGGLGVPQGRALGNEEISQGGWSSIYRGWNVKGLTRWRIKNGGEWNVKVLKRWRIKNGLVMLGQ